MKTTSQSPNPPSRHFTGTMPFRILVATVVLLCAGLLVFKLLKDNTTLSFSFLLDGKPLPVGTTPKVLVDGQPLTSGCTIAPGSHTLTAELQMAEPLERRVWVLFGDKNLGALPLESSKGSLIVSVNPSPASVIVRRGIETVGKGDAPLTVEKLPLGNYDLEIKRGEYKETHPVKIQGRRRTETAIDLNLGGVTLSSDPADAGFQLSGNGRQWDGKLPTRIDDVPVGDYRFVARRKGWEKNTILSVGRGVMQTNKIEFAYGSIEVTSDPAGLMISTNGVAIGKTPLTLQELEPGQYRLVITDGENDLTADVSVAPKEAAKHMFSFDYGAVQLASTPAAATVFRKGKEAGKTPLKLDRIPAGETTVELRLRDYVSTTLLIHTVGGTTTNVSAKLISEHYLQAMKNAREAFTMANFSGSKEFLATALEAEPNDQEAIKLRDEVVQAAAKAEKASQEAAVKAQEAARMEQANAKARMLASLAWLDFQKMISDCTDTRQVQYTVGIADGYTDNKGNFHQTGQHTEMRTRTEFTFNTTKFSEKYEGKTFKFSCPDRWSVAKVEQDGCIVLKAGGMGSDAIRATPPMSNQDAFKSLQKGQKVTIKAVLRKYALNFLVRTIYLEDAEVLDK